MDVLTRNSDIKVRVTTMVTPRGNSMLAFQVPLQILDKTASSPTSQPWPRTEQRTAEGGGPGVTAVTSRCDQARAKGAGLGQPRKG